MPTSPRPGLVILLALLLFIPMALGLSEESEPEEDVDIAPRSLQSSPQLEILSPLQNMSFGTRTALFMWEVDAKEPYTVNISVDGDEFSSVEGDSKRHIWPADGTDAERIERNLTVEVTDADGLRVQKSVQFFTQDRDVPRGQTAITGDGSLMELAEAYGLPGDGSEEDPYLLENIGIDALGEEYGIKVAGTTKHLTLRNITVFNTETMDDEPLGTAILLKDVRNLAIEGCLLRDHFFGVHLESVSHNLRLQDNDLRHSARGAITVNQGEELTISGNDCSQAGRWGVLVGAKPYASVNVTVTDNDCSDHRRYGIALENMEGSHVSGNDVRSTTMHSRTGIYMYGGSSNTVIEGNDCRHNSEGILLRGGSEHNTVRDNDCRHSTQGITVADRSSYNLIDGNNCSESLQGIVLNRAYSNEVKENDCSQSNNSAGSGVHIVGGGGNLVKGNDCSNNRFGILAESSSNQRLEDNDCSDAGNHSILVSNNLDGFSIIGNDCRNSTLDAIRMESDHYGARSNTVKDNDCRGNGGSAVNISAAGHIEHNSIVGNDCRHTPYDMIRAEGSNFTGNLFSGNIMPDAPMMPIELRSSTLNFVSNEISVNHMPNASGHGFALHGNISDLRILDNNVHNASLNAIQVTDSLDGMWNVRIDGNNVSSPGGHGVHLRSNSFIEGGSVSGNYALNIPLVPLSVQSTALWNFSVDDNDARAHHGPPIIAPAPDLRHVSVSGNDLRGCAAGLDLLDRQFHQVSISSNDLRGTAGVLIETSSEREAYGLRIDGNDLRRDGGAAVMVGVDGGLRNSSLSGNDMTGIVDQPLTVVAPHLLQVDVDDNLAPGALDNGISIDTDSMDHVSVSGNILRGSQGAGLLLHAERMQNLTVSYNDIGDAAGEGLSITSLSGIGNLTVSGNDVSNSGIGSLTVRASGPLRDALISDNDCTLSPNHPLELHATELRRAVIDGNDLRDPDHRPLWLNSSVFVDVTVSGNDGSGSGGYGLEMNGTVIRSVTVQDNDFSGSVLDPVLMQSPNDISSVHVRDNLATGGSDHGISIVSDGGLEAVMVEGNTVKSHAVNQIVLEGSWVRHSSVSYNDASGSPSLPLRVDSPSVEDLTVQGNLFHDSAGHAIELRAQSLLEIHILDNDLRDAGGHALMVESTGEMRDIVVAGNDLCRSQDGMRIAAPESVRGLEIRGNTATDLVDGDPALVEAPSLFDVLVVDNSFPDARGTPLTAAASWLDNFTVEGNDFDRSGYHGIELETIGMFDVSIKDNSLHGADGHGILVNSTGEGVLSVLNISNNNGNGVAGDAIRVAAAEMTSVTVSGNDMSGAQGNGMFLHSEGGMSSLVISYNDLNGAAGDGALLRSMTDAELSDSLLKDNNLSHAAGRSIAVDMDAMADVLIDGNDCQNSSAPLDIHASQVTRVQIVGNDLSGSASHGIWIEADVTHILIEDNNITGIAGPGVMIEDYGEMVNVTIVRNTLSSVEEGVLLLSPAMTEVTLAYNTVSSDSNPVRIVATSSQDLSVHGNDISASAEQPLVLEVDEHLRTQVTQNDLSGSADGINVNASLITDLLIEGNVLDGVAGDGIVVSASGAMDSVHVMDNSLAGIAGITVDVHCGADISNLRVVNNSGGGGIAVDGNSIINGELVENVVNGPMAVTADGQVLLQRVDANSLAGELLVSGSSLNVTSIDGNDGGDSLISSADGKIEVGSMRNNNLGGVDMVSASFILSERVDGNVFDSLDMNAMDRVEMGTINGNEIGEALNMTGSMLDIGSIDGNDVGPCSLESTEGNISVTSFSENIMTSVTLLSAASISSDRVDGNNAGPFSVQAPGVIAVGAMSDNDLIAPDVALRLDGGSIIVGELSRNTFQAVDGVWINASVVEVPILHENIITADGTGLTVLAGEAFRGGIDSNQVYASAGIVISSPLIDIATMDDNLFHEVDAEAVNLTADELWADSLGGNILVDGSPGHFILVNAGSAQLGSVTANTMNVPSISEGILMDCTVSLSIDVFAENTVEGGVLLSAPTLSADITENSVLGELRVSGGTVDLVRVSGNSVDSLTMLAVDLSAEEVSYNTGDVMEAASELSMDIGAVEGNTFGSDMGLGSAGSLSIGSVVANECGLLLLVGNGSVTLGAVDDNRLNSLELLTDGPLEAVSIDGNQFDTLEGRSLNVSAATAYLGSLSDNVLVNGGPEHFISVSADAAELGAVDGNRMDAVSIMDAVLLECGTSLNVTSIGGNDLRGDLRAVSATLGVDDVRGNSLEGDLLLEGGYVGLGTVTGNGAGTLSIQGDELTISVVEGNDIDTISIQSSGAAAIGPVLENNASSVSVAAGADLTIGTVGGNHFNGAVDISAAGDLSAGDFDGNSIHELSVSSGGALSLLSVTGNALGPTDGTAIELTGGAVELSGAMQGNTLTGYGHQSLLVVHGESISVLRIADNTVEQPCAAEALLLQAERGIVTGDILSNSFNGPLLISSEADIALGDVSANHMSGLQASSGAGLSSGSVAGNVLEDRLVLEGVSQVIVEDVVGNELNGITAFSGGPLAIGDLSNNRLFGATGDAIYLNATELEMGAISGNSLQSGSPDRLLNVEAGSADIASMDLNTMVPESGAEAMRLVVSENLSIGGMDGNALKGDVLLDSPDIAVGDVTGNGMHHLFVNATHLRLGSLADNTVHDVSVAAESLEAMGAISDNDMHSFTLVSPGPVHVPSVTDNRLSADLIIEGGSLDIGGVEGNEMGSLRLISEEGTALARLSWNVVSGDALISANGFECGPIDNNTVTSLSVGNGDVRIAVVERNDLDGELSLNATGLMIDRGILHNRIAQGLTVVADSSSTLLLTQNSLLECDGDGIFLEITDGIDLLSTGNEIAGGSGDGIRLLSGSTVALDSSDDTVSVFSGAAVSLEAPWVEAVIVGLNAEGCGTGLSADNVMSLWVSDSRFQGCGTGAVLSGEGIEIVDSEFQSNDIGAVFQGVEGLVFTDNTVSGSAIDGLRLTGCHDGLLQSNVFTDNTGFALNATGCDGLLVSWNLFYDNNGAGAVHEPGSEQAHDDGDNQWSAARYPGSGGTEGNFWSDLQDPDENNDGIVDIPYSLSGGAEDPHPLRGEEDIYPPWLRIGSPADGSNHSYEEFELEWTAMDNRSGISEFDTVLSVDGATFATVPASQTSLTIDPLELQEGYRVLSVKVTDNSGNTREESITILIDRTPPSIVVTSHEDGDIVPTPFHLHWDVEDEFDPDPRVDIRVSGGPWTEGVSSPYEVDPLSALEDGEHVIELRAVDHLGNENLTSVTVVVDNTPPELTIVQPSEGDYVNESVVSLVWEVSDDSPYTVEVSEDAVAWTEAEGDSHEFTLDDGQHTLYVRAVDAAGNENTSSVNFTVDTVAPEIDILSPDEGVHLDDGSVTLEWTVTDDSPFTVQVSDDGVTWVDPQEEGSHLFVLDDGQHTLYVRAVDAAGNVNTSSVNFTVDTEPPQLDMVSPDNGSYQSQPFELHWTVDDAIDEDPQVQYRVEGGEWIMAEDSPLLFDEFAEGERLIEMRAEDEAGNEANASLTVIIDDTPPELEIVSPDEGDLLSSETVTLSWTVSDDSPYTVEVSEDAVAWTEAEGDSHEFTLDDGQHTLYVRAVDAAGNVNTSSVNFTVDTEPPQINIISPASGSVLDESSVTLEWDVDDLSGYSMEVSSDGTEWISKEVYQHTFELQEGEHTLYVRAVDEAGNEAMESVDVVIDLSPPEVEITSPEEGEELEQLTVLMTWSVEDMSECSYQVWYDDSEPVAVEDEQYEFELPEEGEYVLWVNVTDAFGRSTLANVTVNVTDGGSTTTGLLTTNELTMTALAVGGVTAGATYMFVRPRWSV